MNIYKIKYNNRVKHISHAHVHSQQSLMYYSPPGLIKHIMNYLCQLKQWATIKALYEI